MDTKHHDNESKAASKSADMINPDPSFVNKLFITSKTKRVFSPICLPLIYAVWQGSINFCIIFCNLVEIAADIILKSTLTGLLDATP